MARKNRYYSGSKISERKFRQVVRLFALDLNASIAAKLTGLSVRSTNSIFLRIRQRMAEYCATQSPFSGDYESDKNWSDLQLICTKSDVQKSDASIVFGLLKRGNCVYTKIVTHRSKAKLKTMIRGRLDPNSVTPTDIWRCYDALVDMGGDKLFRVNHGNREFVGGSKYINIIESFWSYFKHRLAQFYGIANHTFVLHLKETEFRFNHRHEDLYLTLLKLLRDKPL